MDILITLLIYFVILAVVVYYVIPLFPPQTHMIARAVVGVIALLICLALLTGAGGLPVVRWK